MTTVGRGIRNAFRNAVRTVSVVVILGLSFGLSLVMLTAYHSVTAKVATTLSSIGNTVTIHDRVAEGLEQPQDGGFPAPGAPVRK